MTSDGETNPAAAEQAVDCNQATQHHPAGPTASGDVSGGMPPPLREAIGSATLAELADELGRLRSAMLLESRTPEQDAAVAAVADAETAARHGDAKAVLAGLRTAGEWAGGMAEKIGVGVAARAITSARNVGG